MACSLSKAKNLSVFVANGVSKAIFRRRYAVGSQGVTSGIAKGGVSSRTTVTPKSSEEKVQQQGSAEKESWVPDPKTGNYRPANGAQEIDPVELRAAFSKNTHQ